MRSEELKAIRFLPGNGSEFASYGPFQQIGSINSKGRPNFRHEIRWLRDAQILLISNVRSRQEFISWTLLGADAFASVRRASAILVDETPAASILQSLASALRRDQAYCHRFFFFFAIRRPKPPISSSSMNATAAAPTTKAIGGASLSISRRPCSSG